MRGNIVEQVAEWHACRMVFSGLETMPDSFTLNSVIQNDRLDVPEGWLIWEPFETLPEETIIDILESTTESYVEYFRTVLQNGTYFAADGNYGGAEHLAVVSTHSWSDDDWDEIEAASDWGRPDVAKEIATRHSHS